MIDGSPGERKKILLFSYTFSIILTILLLAMVITNLTWSNFPTRPQWLINCTTKYESIILSFYSLVSFEKTVGPKFKYQTPKCHGIPLHDNYSCLVYSCKKKSYRIVKEPSLERKNKKIKIKPTHSFRPAFALLCNSRSIDGRLLHALEDIVVVMTQLTVGLVVLRFSSLDDSCRGRERAQCRASKF